MAAVNNNGIGVCGVAGGTGNGDGVRLMSCQISRATRRATPSCRVSHKNTPRGSRRLHPPVLVGVKAGIYTSDNMFIKRIADDYEALQYAAQKNW